MGQIPRTTSRKFPPDWFDIFCRILTLNRCGKIQNESCTIKPVVMKQIEITEGDITRLAVDAIVNAANNSLLGGGGVDGAIHRAAGPELLEETKKLGGCKTGDACITDAYRLPSRKVIHTVGPIYRDGHSGEPELLGSCYRRSIQIARENQLSTVAFPSISTGVYGYPVEKAAVIALETIMDELKKGDLPERIVCVCFDRKTSGIYRETLEKIQKGNTI